MDGTVFEDEVRRIARILWPESQFSGSVMIDGRERDGVFVSDDYVHSIECTTERAKAKAEDDIDKLVSLSRKLKNKHPKKAIKSWFVTLHEPTADQRAALDHRVAKAEGAVEALSFDQFRGKLVQARDYLEARRVFQFGSIRDPETGLYEEDAEQYSALDIALEFPATETWNVTRLADELLAGRRVLLLGDYGAGKSMTAREIHRILARRFMKNEIRQFPLTLNLRDHQGQREPVEAIERHARRVGFPIPSNLVRAWRAGLVTLVLDGFDEIASSGWTGQGKRLRDIRFAAMQILRTFIRESPSASGVLITGRAHLFDSIAEMERALAVGASVSRASLTDFSDEQVTSYLRKRGFADPIPDWLPPRPLLLGYLASRNLLVETIRALPDAGPARGWNALIRNITEREAEIEAGIDGIAVRGVMERLASRSRRGIDGISPLALEEIVSSFREICGSAPDDKSMVLLQRLPGLGVADPESGTRAFIDRDFAAACAAGDVVRFAADPFAALPADQKGWHSSLLPLGIEVAAQIARETKVDETKLGFAAKRAADLGFDTLACDLIRVLGELDVGYSGSRFSISGVTVPAISFDGESKDFSAIEFHDCLFSEIDLDPTAHDDRLPRFVRCVFGLVEGRLGEADVPKSIFDSCEFYVFGESAKTANAILEMAGLPLATRVTLTVLKKLYLQRGAGRRETALFRGLDNRGKALIPAVLGLLRRQGLAVESGRHGAHAIWMPVRAQTSRVNSVLTKPNTCGDPVIAEASNL